MITKSQLDKIGKQLIQDVHNDEILQKLSDWRGLHIYPLNQAFKIIKKKADKIGNNAIYGQRLKRINSIITKLKRFNTRLSTMQDIGGCRVIFTDFSKVYNLFLELKKSNSIKELDNYIFRPKADGYRSIHLIYTLKSKQPQYDGLHIEIQIRTLIQHAWATTLEIVDFVEKQELKLGKGDNDWKRFFYLVAEEFAFLEGLPLHNNIIDSNQRKDELREIDKKLDIFNKIHLYANIINILPRRHISGRYVIINIERKDKQFNIKGTRYTSFNDAKQQHILFEKEQINNTNKNILLVETKSLKELKKAYPNYFVDTSIFLDTLHKILSKKIDI